jgi:hypothetical protein
VIACPGCRSTAVREVTVGKRRRAECAGCSRFVGWVQLSEPNTGEPSAVTVASTMPAVAEVSSDAPTWLYVSRRLDFTLLPNTSLWSADAIMFGSVVYYRLSARVLVWLELAGEDVERQWLEGRLARSELDVYLAAMVEVWVFADRWLSREAMRVVRREGRADRTSAAGLLPEWHGPVEPSRMLPQAQEELP